MVHWGGDNVHKGRIRSYFLDELLAGSSPPSCRRVKSCHRHMHGRMTEAYSNLPKIIRRAFPGFGWILTDPLSKFVGPPIPGKHTELQISLSCSRQVLGHHSSHQPALGRVKHTAASGPFYGCNRNVHSKLDLLL